MSNSHFIWIYQTATFSAVLAPTILRSGVVRLLTWCRLAGFSYVVRPFARSRHPLMLSSYFFSTHTILCINMSKNYLPCPLNETLIWRKIVAARTTYFIRYKDLPLRRQRGIQLLNGTKKSVTEEGFGPIDPVIRNQPALSRLSYSVWLGRNKINE